MKYNVVYRNYKKYKQLLTGAFALIALYKIRSTQLLILFGIDITNKFINLSIPLVTLKIKESHRFLGPSKYQKYLEFHDSV